MGAIGEPGRTLAAALAAALCLALPACGEGGGQERGAPQREPPAPERGEDSGGGAEQFRVEGGDNSVQEFGEEASEAELRAAAAALHGFLEARAERRWAAACAQLSQEARRGLAGSPLGEPGGGCAASLEALAGGLSGAALREAARVDVGSLRAAGGQGFLLYRGPPEGTVYAISMSEQGGAWKVASLAGIPLG